MDATPTVDTAIRDGQYGDDANLGARIALHARFSTNPQGWYAWLGERVDLTPAIDVLELGCGEGGFWAANADRLPTGAHLTLTDFSPGMLAAAERRLRPLLPNARFAVADAQAIPSPDAAFDVVIANHMLYHVPDLDRTLREIRRVLRPDGRLHAATNGERHMAELAELVRTTGADAGSFTVDDAFALETGDAALARHFGRVEREDYPDALVVTDAEAVVRYVRSTVGAAALDDPAIDRLRTIVDDHITRDGAFRITKATGLFTATGTAAKS